MLFKIISTGNKLVLDKYGGFYTLKRNRAFGLVKHSFTLRL